MAWDGRCVRCGVKHVGAHHPANGYYKAGEPRFRCSKCGVVLCVNQVVTVEVTKGNKKGSMRIEKVDKPDFDLVVEKYSVVIIAVKNGDITFNHLRHVRSITSLPAEYLPRQGAPLKRCGPVLPLYEDEECLSDRVKSR